MASGSLLETMSASVTVSRTARSFARSAIQTRWSGSAAPLQRVRIALRANERAVLETVTLHDIVSGELPEAIQLLTDSPQAWV